MVGINSTFFTVKSDVMCESARVKWHVPLLGTAAPEPGICMVYPSLKIHKHSTCHICMHAGVTSSVRESPGATYSNLPADKAFRQSSYQTLSPPVCLWIFQHVHLKKLTFTPTGCSTLQATQYFLTPKCRGQRPLCSFFSRLACSLKSKYINKDVQ